MAKIERFTKRPSCNSPAQHVLVNRKSRDNSAPVLVSVRFMELRPSMCRWPIGDPQHLETFRFCGSACPSKVSYCKKHNAIAHHSNRPGTSRKTDFRMRASVA